MQIPKNINEFSRFTTANLHKEGRYVVYYPPQGDPIKLARFEIGSPAASFMKLLRKDFNVLEYFTRLQAGECAIEIARSKGYKLTGYYQRTRR